MQKKMYIYITSILNISLNCCFLTAVRTSLIIIIKLSSKFQLDHERENDEIFCDHIDSVRSVHKYLYVE